MGFFNFRHRTAAPAPVLETAAPAFGRRTPRLDSVRFFHLRTGRGDWLRAGNPRIGMGAEPAPDRIFAAVPDANRQFLFLLAPSLKRIEVQSDGLSAVAISGFRVQAGSEALVRIKHPLAANRYLGVTRPGEGSAEGCVVFDSFGRTALDAFQLEEVPPGQVTEGVRLAAMELAEAAGRPYRAETLLELLRQGVVRGALAEPLIRLLPLDELELMAARLLHDGAELGLLREAAPDNPWFARVLPELAQWNRARSRLARPVVSPAADEMAGDPVEGHGQPQAGHALVSLARRRVSARNAACVLASARNEGPWLLEWLAHHRAIGFEHVFLYSNENEDGSDELLEALAAAGVITWIRNEPGTHYGPQLKAYAHALTLLPQILDYRWTAILDLDEYFCFDTGMFAGVQDFIAFHETQPVDAIALCWLIFAAGAEDRWGEGPTTCRFVQREPGVNPHVKTLFRTSRFWHSQSHFPYSPLGLPFSFRTESGALHHHPQIAGRLPAFSEAPSAAYAWVNHYLLRSAPEALWKLARGRGDWPARTPERAAEFRQFVCRSFVSLANGLREEDRRIAGCAPDLHRELARLQALPGVAEAEARIRRAIPARLRLLAERFAAEADMDSPATARFGDMLRHAVD